jgi:acyl-CoA thioester hydrolase
VSAPFEHRLRVYWEDTDAGGVVFYANYLKFFERARTEWLRALGFGQETLRTERGLMFVVAETTVRYLAPARLDDLVAVTAVLAHRGRASLDIEQEASRVQPAPGGRLAEGRIRIGCVEAATLRPTRIPDDLLARLA